MRIAITGHLGTLGAPLMKRLLSEGHEVIGVDSRHSETGIRADISEYRQLESALTYFEADYVYHLAAEFGRHNGEEFTEQLWKTNVIGTKNMLRLQRDLGFRMIFASSSEVYGESTKSILTEADVASSPSALTNDYAISKWVNEGQIANAKKQWGNQTMVLRFFNAYGPGEHYHAYRSVVCLFAYRAIKGLPYDVYDGYHRVFQYIDDMIDTLSAAKYRFCEETINLGGVEYRSVDDMHRTVSKIVGVDPMRNTVSHWPEDHHNIVNKKPDITLAQQLLGHEPKVALEDGIQRTVDWMREIYG